MTTDAGGASVPPRRPCAGKTIYRNRKLAASAASRTRKRLAKQAGGCTQPLHAYHCHCGGWHIGHPIGWRRAHNVPRPLIRLSL